MKFVVGSITLNLDTFILPRQRGVKVANAEGSEGEFEAISSHHQYRT